uniref:Cell surface hydrophobicity-associated protein n=1 Tax=Ganoderma boninense TaxID=34458 RepID=A0A5K1K822_9APHY
MSIARVTDHVRALLLLSRPRSGSGSSRLSLSLPGDCIRRRPSPRSFDALRLPPFISSSSERRSSTSPDSDSVPSQALDAASPTRSCAGAEGTAGRFAQGSAPSGLAKNSAHANMLGARSAAAEPAIRSILTHSQTTLLRDPETIPTMTKGRSPPAETAGTSRKTWAHALSLLCTRGRYGCDQLDWQRINTQLSGDKRNGPSPWPRSPKADVQPVVRTPKRMSQHARITPRRGTWFRKQAGRLSRRGTAKTSSPPPIYAISRLHGASMPAQVPSRDAHTPRRPTGTVPRRSRED